MTVSPETKQFLARVVHWPQEGEPEAFVNIHNTFTPSDLSEVKTDKNGKKLWPWTGQAFKALDRAASYIDWQSNGTGRDIYFCTSTQRLAKAAADKRGRTFYKAVRAQENVVYLKSLFIDIDLKGGDHGYDTIDELRLALAKFIVEVGLPKPSVIVDSGGGRHIYWTFLTPLPLDQWMVWAFALAEATKRHGLKCDSQCTVDGARILRVPGTVNMKYDPPAPVKLELCEDFDYANERITKCLEPYKVKVPYTMDSVNFALFPPKAPIEGDSDLSAGIEANKAKPVPITELVNACPFVSHSLATGGVDNTNPLWNLTCLIATFTEEGDLAAHAMAAGHPDYEWDSTQALYERKMQDRLVRNVGWPSCANINASGCAQCATCPHLSKGKSPLNFAVPQQAPLTGAVMLNTAAVNATSQGNTAVAQPLYTPAPAPDPDLPPNYRRDPATGVVMVGRDEEGGLTRYIPIIEYPMTDARLFNEPDWTMVFMSDVGRGPVQMKLTMEHISTSDMRRELQRQGFMLDDDKNAKEVTKFIVSWIRKLQSSKAALHKTEPLGWVEKNSKLHGFVYNERMFTPFGEEVAFAKDPQLIKQYSPNGDRSVWIECADMVTCQRRPELDIIIASAFAGPLVKFTGHPGLFLSAYSVESGIGKSTALKVAQAVWGDPVKAVQSLGDTANSVIHKLGNVRSLPLYWDELQTEEQLLKFTEIVFQLTQGKEKSRLNSRVEQRDVGTWQTLLVAAANDSIMDMLPRKGRGTMAGLYRVFEFTVSPPKPGSAGQINPAVAQRNLARLHNNYGTIGLEYAEYLGKHHAMVDKMVADASAKLSATVKAKQDERFWLSIMATLYVGAVLANKLNFTKIDLKGMLAFLVSTFNEMRNVRQSHTSDISNPANLMSVLQQFLGDKRAKNTIETNIIYRGRGKAPTGTVNIITDLTRLEAIHVHIGHDDKTLRFSTTAFGEWLAKRNMSRHVLLQAFERHFGAKQVRARLAAGTVRSTIQDHLVEIDLTAAPGLDFISEN